MAKESTFRTVLSLYGPTVLFGLLTMVGVIFIWVAKLADVSAFVVTAIPIIIMCVYFGVSLAAGMMRVHNEQAGDNLYYMGFLFTLSSLGVSLYRFVGEVSIDEIVRNFGIAITSTICGIAFRILFNQVRRDPIDIERTVRHELAEMTRRVRSELETSSMEFSSYRRTSSQMLLEGFEEIARQAERTGDAIHRSIETLAKESIKPIAEAAQSLAKISEENLRIVEERAAATNAATKNSTEQLNLQNASLAEKVVELQKVVEALTAQVAAFAVSNSDARDEMKASLAAVAQGIENLKEATDGSSVKAAAQADTLRRATESLERLPERIEQSLGPIGVLSEVLEKTTKSVAALPEQLASATGQIQRAKEEITALTAAREAVEAVKAANLAGASVLTATRGDGGEPTTAPAVALRPTDENAEPQDKPKKWWSL